VRRARFRANSGDCAGEAVRAWRGDRGSSGPATGSSGP
jgi:hypothetical protein